MEQQPGETRDEGSAGAAGAQPAPPQRQHSAPQLQAPLAPQEGASGSSLLQAPLPAATAPQEGATGSSLARALRSASALASPAASPPGSEQQQLARLSRGSSVASMHECRICLAADQQSELVEPCSCRGTVRFAHVECLKAWVSERGSLECELCRQPFKPALHKQLAPLAAAGARRLRSRSAGEAVLTINGEEAQAEPQAPPPALSWSRFWIHCAILTMLLVSVIYLALFVNVGSSDNLFLVVLWRTITVILPLFLILRCLAALFAWQRAWREQRAAARQQQAGDHAAAPA